MRWRKTAGFFGSIIGSRLGARGPIHLSHLVTGRCDCRCPTCIWKDNELEELQAREIEALYRGAKEAGFVANAIWGGEPLLRQDLDRICRASRQCGMITTVITNGYSLPERARDLAGEVDCFIVSLDYPEAGAHDAFRGRPGLFQRAVEGIEALRRLGSPDKVIINCLLHRGNETRMPEMAELAQSLGVSLYVCPASEGTRRDTGESNQDTIAAEDGQRQAASELLRLKRDYPINNSRTYLRRYLLQGRSYLCRAPLVFITVTPEGDVVNCFRGSAPYGNVRETDFARIMKQWDRREALGATRGCHRCGNPNIVDTSYIWRLTPEPLLNAVGMFLTR